MKDVGMSTYKLSLIVAIIVVCFVVIIISSVLHSTIKCFLFVFHFAMTANHHESTKVPNAR